MNCPYSKNYESSCHFMIDEIYEDQSNHCKIDHGTVDDAIRDLVQELYSFGDLNIDRIKRCLQLMCDQYEVYFDNRETLDLVRSSNQRSNLFDFIKDYKSRDSSFHV
jgi:hypothetical protein